MKNILCIALILLFSSFSLADESFVDPSLHLGLGIEMGTGTNSSDYGMIQAKGFLLRLGDEEMGVRVIGLGVGLNSHGDASLVVPLASYYLNRFGLGPELIVRDSKTTNFGISLSYRF